MSDLLESLDNIRTLQDLADRYVLGSLLGEGRFSKVWSATPSTSDAVVASSTTPVALKEIALDVLEDDEEAFEMLEAEVAALRHASTHDSLGERVVKLHEVVKTDEYIFLVLDRVPGDELFNVIDERGHLPLPTVHSIMRQLLSALTALHGLGIVHRDIKPENLMVDGLDDLASLRLTLIDFGYADVKCGGAQLQRLAARPSTLRRRFFHGSRRMASRTTRVAMSGVRGLQPTCSSPVSCRSSFPRKRTRTLSPRSRRRPNWTSSSLCGGMLIWTRRGHLSARASLPTLPNGQPLPRRRRLAGSPTLLLRSRLP